MTINIKMRNSAMRGKEDSQDSNDEHDTEIANKGSQEQITFENFIQPLFKVEKVQHE